ncbi:alpha-glucosidase [Desemzia sp. RIT804]|uniref:alpha-glucosidase n=1 Tax=Desemzia sp. RIT 804 TaxID=2810209 RepID=UPI0019507087|nr:alpha-glucosidase [Desemzia sp. RIT 804]MBM6615336.1 alpha-glucosidase [Desemzia sp. RIT 804]
MKTKIKTAPVWWKEEVVYQIYPKSFRDSNGDGIGDINGITEKLDYLSDLGITMIWICPIFKSPMVDNGYDISDYQDINPEFGTMHDFDVLLEEAKKRGIKIIIDLVVNHTSDKHNWFKEAISNPKSKYRDYYIFKKGTAGTPPNNWRSIFGGSVWEPVLHEEDTYYFHTFDKTQPDLNWENPELRSEIYQMINWWLDKGISGFRVDSITFIKKDQDYESLPPDGLDGLASVKLKGRNRPGIAAFLSELNRETFQKYSCVSVGEAPGVGYEEFDQYIGENGYFNMIFDFHYADIDVESGSEWFRRTNWTVSEFKEQIFTSQEELQRNGWGANFLENHDQPRSISKYIRDKDYQNSIGAKALGALFFFLRGTPFIYQGQEIGMDNFNRSSIEAFNDVSSIDNFHRSILEGFSEKEALNFVNLRSRDNGRTPFQWNASKYGDFSEVEPWLELADISVKANVQAQEINNDSVLTFYKKMISLRNGSKYKNTLIYGEFHPLDTPEQVIGYERVADETVEVYINLSSEFSEVTTNGEILLSNYKDVETEGQSFILAPYQLIVLRKEV